MATGRLSPAQPRGVLSAAVTALAFAPDGHTITGASADGDVRRWSTTSGRRSSEPSLRRTARVSAVTYDATGARIATAGSDGAVTVIRSNGNSALERRFSVRPRARAIAVDPTGRLAAAAMPDGSVDLHRLPDGQRASAPLRGSRGTGDVAFSTDGRRLAIIGSESEARVWNVRGRPRLVNVLHGFTENFHSLTISPREQLAATSTFGSFELWDLRAQSTPSRARADPVAASIYEAVFTPDGSRIVTVGARGLVRLWSTKADHPSGPPLAGHSGDVTQAAIGRNGHLLATGGTDGLVRLWDLSTRQALGGAFDEGGGAISEVALTPRGDVLAVADHAGVTFWQVTPRRVLGVKLPLGSASGELHAEGDRLVLLSGTTVQTWSSTLWTDDLERLRGRVCGLLSRDLTRAEWDRFVPGQPYRTSCA